MIDLTGRHIFIAGGGRGIGAASAKMAAAAGAVISINYLSDSTSANRVVDDIKQTGGKAFTIKADVSVDGEMDRAVSEAEKEFGQLQGMVVSAGIFEPEPIETMSAEFWDRTLDINLRGTFLSVRAGVKSMRSGGKGGSIVIYTSTAGQRGSSVYSAYATSKGGQIMFMRSMAMELAPSGIRVNCIAPSWTDTDMAAPSLDAAGREEVAKSFPLGHICLPDEVAGPTCFLLSDVASFITGVTLTVDGGIDMRG